jgi:hypothetical protein
MPFQMGPHQEKNSIHISYFLLALGHLFATILAQTAYEAKADMGTQVGGRYW